MSPYHHLYHFIALVFDYTQRMHDGREFYLHDFSTGLSPGSSHLGGIVFNL